MSPTQQLRLLDAVVLVTRGECLRLERSLRGREAEGRFCGYEGQRFNGLRVELAQWHRLRNQVLQES